MTLLEVDGLTKVFRRRRLFRPPIEHRAVDDVSFRIERGRTLAIVGESGAGKSTIARLVTRLIEPDSGSVRFDGVDLLALSSREMRERRRDIQMIFQDPYGSFDPRVQIGVTVAEPLKAHFGMNRPDREKAALEALVSVGLGAHHLHRRPHQLSGGQLQRVSIARALTVDPKLILCDEAVAALDVSIRGQVLNLLLDIQESRGVSYLFIAHDLAIVEAFADDVVVMKAGRVMEAAPAAELFARPASEYTRQLLDASPIADPARRRRRAADRSAARGGDSVPTMGVL